MAGFVIRVLIKYTKAMRLYLSSAGLGDHVEVLRDLMRGGNKLLYISNAQDDWSALDKQQHVAEKLEEYRLLGFDARELDLRQYFAGNLEALKDQLADCDLVWCGGGNTFLLRRALSYSGLDGLLGQGLAQDRFVYGGSSAGSIIPTPSLRGTENGDDPLSVPEQYKPEIIWEGLGLIQEQIVPHYQSDWFAAEAQGMIDYFEKAGTSYRALRDGQVYMVDGSQERLLG